MLLTRLPILLQAVPNEPPNVWRQLLRACLCELDGTPTLKLQMAEELEELKQLTKQQQRQLVAQEQHVQQQQERIGRQAEELAGLRQEMQAMQAQLRQLLAQQQQ